jgi:hypothetical protein
MLEIIAALTGLAGILASLLAWPAALGVMVWAVLRREFVRRKLLAATVFVFLPYAIGTASGNLWSLGTDHPEFYLPAESSLFTFSELEGSGGSGEWWTYAKDRTNVYFNNQDGTYLFSPLSEASSCRGFNETKLDTWCIRKAGKRNGDWL